MGKVNVVIGGVLLLAVAVGAPAFGAPGDIISSFTVQTPALWIAGVYRDGAYVYFAVSWAPVRYDSVYKYTPDGALVDFITFNRPNNYPINDPDHSRLGDGYMTAGTEGDFLITYDLTTGRWVENTEIGISDIMGYAYRGDGARFAFAMDDAGIVYKFNPAWNVVASFPWGGALAATRYYDGRAGNYVIVNGNPADVYTGAGSLVGTFPSSVSQGCVCGPGYPASWGTTFWNYGRVSADTYMIYQIDLGNGLTAVEPASLGKVKALYR
ncbi:MAG: hypothetical protein PVH29_04695 [Candidatus Zixiibacteriota bacterium]|jgi:hypothetical protein